MENKKIKIKNLNSKDSINYHVVFRNIDKRVVKEVRNIIKSKFFKQTESDKFKVLLDLNKNLCKIYKIKLIKVIIINNYPGIGAFQTAPKRIILNKPSLVTYLHEFYHYKAFSLSLKNNEKLARGWSHSVFYKAAPRHFKQALDKNILLYQKSGKLKIKEVKE